MDVLSSYIRHVSETEGFHLLLLPRLFNCDAPVWSPAPPSGRSAVAEHRRQEFSRGHISPLESGRQIKATYIPWGAPFPEDSGRLGTVRRQFPASLFFLFLSFLSFFFFTPSGTLTHPPSRLRSVPPPGALQGPPHFFGSAVWGNRMETKLRVRRAARRRGGAAPKITPQRHGHGQLPRGHKNTRAARLPVTVGDRKLRVLRTSSTRSVLL